MAGEHVIVPPKNTIPYIKHTSYSTPTQTQEKKQIYFTGSRNTCPQAFKQEDLVPQTGPLSPCSQHAKKRIFY